jgi:hypothetical protein
MRGCAVTRSAGEIDDVDPPLPGVQKIEALIAERGDDPACDEAVLRPVEGSSPYVLGQPTLEGVEILHCEVPGGGESIAMVPVFTRYRYADAAILMNTSWLYLEASAVEVRHIFADMQPHEWLAINPWSGGSEFKLPPKAWCRPPGEGRADHFRPPHPRVIRRRAALRRARRVPGRRGRSAPESS